MFTFLTRVSLNDRTGRSGEMRAGEVNGASFALRWVTSPSTDSNDALLGRGDALNSRAQGLKTLPLALRPRMKSGS